MQKSTRRPILFAFACAVSMLMSSFGSAENNDVLDLDRSIKPTAARKIVVSDASLISKEKEDIWREKQKAKERWRLEMKQKMDQRRKTNADRFMPKIVSPDSFAVVKVIPDPGVLSKHEQQNLAKMEDSQNKIAALLEEARESIAKFRMFSTSTRLTQPILDIEISFQKLNEKQKVARSEFEKWLPQANALRSELKSNPVGNDERLNRLLSLSKKSGVKLEDEFYHRQNARNTMEAEDWCGLEGNSDRCKLDFTEDGQFEGYRPNINGQLAAAQARIESSIVILTDDLREEYFKLLYQLDRKHYKLISEVALNNKKIENAKRQEREAAKQQEEERLREARKRKEEELAVIERERARAERKEQQAVRNAALKREYVRQTELVATLDLSAFNQQDVEAFRLFHKGDDEELGRYYNWSRERADNFISRYAIDYAKMCGFENEVVTEYSTGATKYDQFAFGPLSGMNDYTTARKSPDRVRKFYVPLGFKQLILKTQIGYNYGPSFTGLIKAVGNCESGNPERILENMREFMNSEKPFLSRK